MKKMSADMDEWVDCWYRPTLRIHVYRSIDGSLKVDCDGGYIDSYVLDIAAKSAYYYMRGREDIASDYLNLLRSALNAIDVDVYADHDYVTFTVY
ncbi:MAG: hypothetical protein QW794_00320 [Thermosphaera sp.]